jgi:molybdate transport repressor ModE-like protein
MHIKLKVWFEVDGQYIFGDGRAELLRLIEQSGSIKKAASNLRMSYRHAWGQIRKLEDRLGTKLVETRVGGKGGGEASLTDAAKEFLSDYEKFRNNLDVFIQEESRKDLRNIFFK